MTRIWTEPSIKCKKWEKKTKKINIIFGVGWRRIAKDKQDKHIPA